MFAALEAGQTIALLPLIEAQLGARGAAAWVIFGVGSALVGLAGSAYFQPLVRSIAALQLSGETEHLPANWTSLWRQLAWRCALLLASLQLLFLLLLPDRPSHLQALGWPAVAMIFSAQHLRLLALGRFTAFNGVAWLGEDKWQMAWASGIALLASVGLLLAGGGLLALAAVQLAAQALLVWLAGRGLARLSRRSQARVELCPPSQALSLLCLGLAGFLNVGTDALVAGVYLEASALVDYGMLSRTLALAVAAVGLWVHVRYPIWCARDCAFEFLCRDILRVLAVLALPLLAVALLFMAWQGGEQGGGLGPGLVSLAAANTLLACAVIALGQALLARGAHGFLWPAALLAALAPAFALLLAEGLGASFFLLGYLLGNGLLLALHLIHFLRIGHAADASDRD